LRTGNLDSRIQVDAELFASYRIPRSDYKTVIKPLRIGVPLALAAEGDIRLACGPNAMKTLLLAMGGSPRTPALRLDALPDFAKEHQDHAAPGMRRWSLRSPSATASGVARATRSTRYGGVPKMDE
jgi:hypothetical protein